MAKVTKVKFDFAAVKRCAIMLRTTAQQLDEEKSKIRTIIEQVRESWTGAGSEEYILYLESLLKSISMRIQKINEIASMLLHSSEMAEEADQKAGEALSGMALFSCAISDKDADLSSESSQDYLLPS